MLTYQGQKNTHGRVILKTHLTSHMWNVRRTFVDKRQREKKPAMHMEEVIDELSGVALMVTNDIENGKKDEPVVISASGRGAKSRRKFLEGIKRVSVVDALATKSTLKEKKELVKQWQVMGIDIKRYANVWGEMGEVGPQLRALEKR